MWRTEINSGIRKILQDRVRNFSKFPGSGSAPAPGLSNFPGSSSAPVPGLSKFSGSSSAPAPGGARWSQLLGSSFFIGRKQKWIKSLLRNNFQEKHLRKFKKIRHQCDYSGNFVKGDSITPLLFSRIAQCFETERKQCLNDQRETF